MNLCIKKNTIFLREFKMSDEEEFIPCKSERKLANLFRITPVLSQSKELQNQIITIIKETLKEARDEWCDMRVTTLDAIIKVHQRTNARKGELRETKNISNLEMKLANPSR